MGIIYLILQIDGEGKELYKIGVTKNAIEVRLKCLQTGNPNTLRVLGSYKSTNYNKIEKWLHRQHASKKLSGEWFNLTPRQVLSFEEDCKNIDQTVTMLLEHNPFYN